MTWPFSTKAISASWVARLSISASGGYKLSALEIEGTLLTHDDIAEVAVIGVEDETWENPLSAFVVLKPTKTCHDDALKTWCDGKMSGYKIPKSLHVLDSLPRNAMGKVTKPGTQDVSHLTAQCYASHL